jgi:hypothetical protein
VLIHAQAVAKSPQSPVKEEEAVDMKSFSIPAGPAEISLCCRPPAPLTLVLVLAGALLAAVAPTPAEAQQTLCLRMGAMIQCDTPTTPSSSYDNLNLGDFSDVILRNRELDIRARESAARTELLRQQTELLRRQNEQLRQQAPVEVDPVFSLGPLENGLWPLRMRSTYYSIADHNVTAEEVRTCMAEQNYCGPNLRAFLSKIRIPPQQIGVLP